jgi:hypothetical protein
MPYLTNLDSVPNLTVGDLFLLYKSDLSGEVYFKSNFTVVSIR